LKEELRWLAVDEQLIELRSMDYGERDGRIMVPGIGKGILLIGSDPACDIVLRGSGVLLRHAEIHNERGELVFVNGHAGASSADGRALAPGERVPVDFRAAFVVGDVPLPLEHTAITKSIMTRGQLAPTPGQLVLGRDSAQVSFVVNHSSVSALHCRIDLGAETITDASSTSGSYIGGQRLPPQSPVPLPDTGVVHLGAVPVAVSLIEAISGVARRPPGSAVQRNRHKTVFGQVSLHGAERSVTYIGRTPDNDIVIPHPQVSAQHAQVEAVDGRAYLVDRGSANGTYLRGQRLQPGQRAELVSGEKLYIGPMPLQLVVGETGLAEIYNEVEGEERWAGRPLYEIEAWSIFLEVVDRNDRSRMKVLLDNVSFKALPGDMIALMGPSGAGKTTLLLALNGYMPPTEGLVRINGEDLYTIYDNLRGSIGYVPQDDVVHRELTVFEAVRYSAKFRLPPDYDDDEIEQRVWQTLADLGLESVGHLQIGSPEQKVISGGQRRRVNIALELVTDPVILYLDEPTSGLAADDAASLISQLSKLTRATGKTIIMTIHQPAKEEYEKFTHALILGYGGVPMFFGRTEPDSYDFFSSWATGPNGPARDGGTIEDIDELPVDNPRDMFALITARERPIYEQLRARDPGAQRAQARQQGALLWRGEYYAANNPIYSRMYSGRREVGTGEGRRGVPEGRPHTRGQFFLLLSRYFKTKVRDRIGTGILLAQAPIIGALFAFIFGWQADEVPSWCLGALQQVSQQSGHKASPDLFENLSFTNDNTGALFFMVVAAMWFGTSNAAREIVKERGIYVRERMVNLGLFNYLMSKFVLLSFFCVIQCTVLLGIVFFALGFNGGAPAFAQELAALVTTAVASVGLGLLLSTLVTTPEAAMALTPIALIPQVILGGLMVPATTIEEIASIMYLSPTRWGFEAAIVPERAAIAEDPAWLIDVGDAGLTSAPDFIFDGQFQCATAQLASDQLNGAWAFTSYETPYLPYAVLGAMTLTTLTIVMVILKRRDRI
jgi:ABC-type multidrug transport system ATPase subunit/pSer/pThr/pTyr-binding forkhead associated (FHA) protein